MLKKVLVLLLLWPFLLPPGFCLCRLESLGLRASGAAAVQEEPEPAAPRCACCRNKQPAPSQRLDESRPDVPHSPSCPAHASWEVARAVAPSPNFADVAPLPPCDFPTSEVVAARPSALLILPPPRASHSTTPLYLSCRDLLC